MTKAQLLGSQTAKGGFEIEYKELSLNDINLNLLDKFNRYQKVIRHWKRIDGEWLLIDGELQYMHVSLEYRHNGIGKKLFGLCVEKSKEIGIYKIYISANDSEDTQRFYLGIGCKDAMEINHKMAEEEPYDRQMEYII